MILEDEYIFNQIEIWDLIHQKFYMSIYIIKKKFLQIRIKKTNYLEMYDRLVSAIHNSFRWRGVLVGFIIL